VQKIIPHLWFASEARQAAEFYASTFPDAKVNHVSTLPGTPSGDTDIVSFEIAGFQFMAISAGPYFKINPAISFMLNFDPAAEADAQEKLTKLWNKLSSGGKVLMPLQDYDFSKLYGWIEDKFGVAWQLILSDPDGEKRPFITPSLLFTKAVSGRAAEAIDFYTTIFNNSKKGIQAKYPEGTAPDEKSSLMYADFMLEGQWFAAMDGGQTHEFGFTEAVSLLVKCDTQAEIDDLWQKLSAVPEAEQCGWLKDKFGVSWQIVPTAMDKMLSEGTPEQIKQVTESFLKMKKFTIAELEKAYTGKY
jgi:predicted 3-demethylubiquinone-9 3-methyltransferase (glyoxalase superfamily)